MFTKERAVEIHLRGVGHALKMQQETVALSLHLPGQGKLLAVAADELIIPLVKNS